jgi:hypothetical protein
LALAAPVEESPMKELSPLEMLLRLGGRVALLAGLLAVVGWLTWVMLDVQHMQSGFTLPS